jgi:DNA N-6-adenine-methyltransferase (Dam)
MARNPSLYTSITNEWYTPQCYVEAARALMGAIDLDPASCECANKAVGATCYYDETVNGLQHPWVGKIWLNPPFGRLGSSRQRGQVELWIKKLLYEYRLQHVTEAVVLVNSMTYKRWFDPLWEHPICFISTRLAFYNEQGVGGRSPHGSAIVYMGNQKRKFWRIFREFGPVVYRYEGSWNE